jgi:hypothetical protein
VKRRVLDPVAGATTRGARRLGFGELVYFELIDSLGEQRLQLSSAQKQEVYQVLVRQLISPANSHWRRRPGQLIRHGAVALSLDLTPPAHVLSYRYRMVKRRQQVVESAPAICSDSPCSATLGLPGRWW